MFSWRAIAKSFGIKIMILAFVISSKASIAQTKNAWLEYRSGRLGAAEKSAEVGYRQAKSKKEKAEARKIGVLIAYSLGKTKQSKALYFEAKSLNPSLTIAPSEVLDGSIFTYLNINQDKKEIPKSIKLAGGPRQDVSRNKPLAPLTSQKGSKDFISSKAQAARKLRNSTEQKKQLSTTQTTQNSAKSSRKPKHQGTFLQIICNVKSATLSIDGILAGNVGQLIETNPGKLIFEINAPGYSVVKMKTQLQRGETRKIQVKLTKISEPPILSQKKLPISKQQQPLVSKKQQQAPLNMFGDESLDSSPPTQKPIPYQSSSGVIFQPAETPISSGSPVQGSPYMGPYPNMNQGGPYSPNNQSQFGYPPALKPNYGIPYGGQTSQQNPNYQIPYSGPYPQQPMITIVPIYPAAGMGGAGMGGAGMGGAGMGQGYDPYGGYNYPQPNESSPLNSGSGSGDPFAGSKKKKKKKKKKQHQTSAIVSILPLGIPQFVSNKPLLGVLFGGGQIGAGYLWYKYGQDVKTAQAASSVELARREEEASKLPTAEQPAFDEDTIIYRTAVNKFIKNTENYQTYALLGAGALWGISMIESFAFGSSSATNLDIRSTENIADQDPVSGLNFYLTAIPDRITIGMKWEF